MKKIYMIPAQQVYELEVQQMLCGSITEVGDDLNVVIDSGDSGIFDDDVINARELEEW
jgi:hypothetical protein